MVNGVICNISLPKPDGARMTYSLIFSYTISDVCFPSELSTHFLPLGKYVVKLEKMDVLARMELDEDLVKGEFSVCLFEDKISGKEGCD